MNAIELRIGNLVQRKVLIFPDENKTHTVSAIDIRDCEFYKENWAFEAIELNERWLKKFGFTKPIQKGSIWQLGNFRVNSFGGLGIFESRNHIEVDTVHDLQNLYHALTGQELQSA